jgi:Putative Actinobacterial Holin-X, holin superfamily III
VTSVRDEITDLRSELAPTEEERTAIGGLISDISRDLKALLQQEAALAKAEITSEVSKAGKGVGMLVAAGFAALMGVVFLSTALWWALANVMDQSWAALIVAAVWIVIGTALFVVGRGALRSVSLKPERTLNSIKQIPGAFEGRQADNPMRSQQ